jgi:hypothetical protein
VDERKPEAGSSLPLCRRSALARLLKGARLTLRRCPSATSPRSLAADQVTAIRWLIALIVLCCDSVDNRLNGRGFIAAMAAYVVETIVAQAVSDSVSRDTRLARRRPDTNRGAPPSRRHRTMRKSARRAGRRGRCVWKSAAVLPNLWGGSQAVGLYQTLKGAVIRANPQGGSAVS